MRYRHAILIVLLVIVLDQVVKYYVKTHFFYNDEYLVFGKWFRIHFLENEGMAFGMKLSESGFGKILLTLFRLVAVVFGFYLLKRLIVKGYSNGLIICGSLILAGAMGNLIDSMFYGMIFSDSFHGIATTVPFGTGYGKFLHGRVVDMLYFPLFRVPLPGGRSFEFFEPVFNIADASISIGVLVLLFFQKRLIHKKPAAVLLEQHRQEQQEAAPQQAD